MDYARALVEHPKWAQVMELESSDGMVTLPDRHGRRFVWGNGYFPQISGPSGVRGICDKGGWDINHTASKGVLLHMLREATGTQDACASWLGGEWRLYGWIGASALGRYATEGEALAAALLAVWGDAA